jgi:hypothetical protein
MLVKPLKTPGGAVDAIYRWMNEGTTLSPAKVPDVGVAKVTLPLLDRVETL